MKEAVKAKWGIDKETGKRAVRYIYSDGTDSLKIGGTKAWRNNNPGNVGCSAYMESLGAIACDDAGRSIFPDWETGEKAMARLLRKGDAYKNAPIAEAIYSYAPEFDEKKRKINDPEAYIDYITSKTRFPRTKKISDMTDDEFDRFRTSMKEMEDSTPGYSLTDFGDGKYYKQDYLQINKDKSSRDFSNYGPNIPTRYKDFIEFTPTGDFKTKSRIPVDSSNVKNIGYDESRQTLEVEFDDGGVYRYSSVPPDVFERFMNAGSKGTFLHREIKENYNYSRVG